MDIKLNNQTVSNNDSLTCYSTWMTPIVIISDGPYGVNGYPGDLRGADGLAKWYEPHIKMWSQYSTPSTTLWFWNTEEGWAAVHHKLLEYGWEFKACNVWNKGLGHIAGNVNTRTLKQLPVVTEVCVQYVRKAEFKSNGKTLSMKEWLRSEWSRTRIPFSKANVACGVKDAATRKYLTKCDLWYMPDSTKFGMLVDYANKYGDPLGKPYFSIDGVNPLTPSEWDMFRPKFYCPIGVTNVWNTPQLSGKERLKNGTKTLHLNQKPLELIKRIIEMSSDPLDVVWDPFSGLCTVSIASIELNRISFSAEISSRVFEQAIDRIRSYLDSNQIVSSS